ncbi:unnamed protein product, partial [marine sediment metagenome]
TTLSVRYCVGKGPDVVMRTWSTSDTTTLEELRRELAILEVKPLSLIFKVKTNQLKIGLSTGNTIEAYVGDDDDLCMHDPDRPKRSYSIRVTPAFVRKLRDRIAADTGQEVRFYYDREVNITPSPADGG